ncbi:MAG: S8 family serine peptidase [Alphaproteobacteria bacterium]|nr:S8 family serine peptidase [Alphaproteobacteria bacterium]
MRNIIAFSLIWLIFVGFGSAQTSASIELDSRSRAALEGGDRARVIVEFDVPEIAFAGAAREDRDIAQIAAVDMQSRLIFQRTFGTTPEAVFATSRDQIQHVQTFRYTPAMVLYADQNALDLLASDPSVTSIITDNVDQPVLSDATMAIGANLVHTWGERGEGNAIAVLDTGIFYEHPAFSGRISSSACFSTALPEEGTQSTCPNGGPVELGGRSAQACHLDQYGESCAHGSHVASIAMGDSGLHPTLGQYDLVGVAPGATVIPVQVFSYIVDYDFCGTSVTCIGSYVSDQIAALEWLYQNRQILELTSINMSLGGGSFAEACDDDSRAHIIGELVDEGIAVVIAAGNQNIPGEVSAPACITSAVAVSGGNFAKSGLIDFLAPTYVEAAGDIANGNLIQAFNGTSMASPQVAGSIALLMAAFPNATLDDIIAAFRITGDYRYFYTLVDGRSEQIQRPQIRVDLAYLNLFEGFAPQSPVLLDAPGAIVFTGMVDEPDTFNSERIQIQNNSSENANWAVTDYGDMLSFSWVPSETSQPVPYSTNDDGISGFLAPGETVTLTLQLRQTPDNTQAISGQIEVLAGGTFRQISLNVLPSLRPPPNDDLRNAIFYDSSEFNPFVRFGRASFETGEPLIPGADGSVWFAWLVPFSGTFTIHKSGYGDPHFTVFVATDGSITEVTDLPPPLVSDVTSYTGDAVRDEVYYIQVASADSRNQDISLFVRLSQSTPFGSSIANAYPLVGNSGYVDPLTLTWQPGVEDDWIPEGSIFQRGDENRQAWFRWTAPYDGTFYISTEYELRPHNLSMAIYSRSDGISDFSETDDPAVLSLMRAVEFDGSDRDDPLPNLRRQISAQVEAGRTYWIRFGGIGFVDDSFTYGYGRPSSGQLMPSVLPTIRRVGLGQPVTAFMTIINPLRGNRTAVNCRIEPTLSDFRPQRLNFPFSYQRTNALNEPVGDLNPTFDLAPGSAQSFVLRFEPALANLYRPQFSYTCDNVLQPAFSWYYPTGQFIFSAAHTDSFDIIPIAVTPTADGIIDVSNTATSAFALAAVNNGEASGSVWIRSHYNLVGPGGIISARICETNSNTGQCIRDRDSIIEAHFEPGEIKTFSVFLIGTQTGAAFRPADQRIFLDFLADTSSASLENLVGRTSVAIRTIGD